MPLFRRKATAPYLRAAFTGKQIPRNPALTSKSEVDKSLLRELMEDNVDLTLIRKEVEELIDAHEYLPLTFNEHLLHFLHSLPLEIFIITLIIVDVCLVLASMIIEVYVDEATLEETQTISNEFLQYLSLLSSTNSCQAIHPSVVASLGDPNAAHVAISSVLQAHAESNLSDSSTHERRKRASSGTGSPSISVSTSVSLTLEEVVHVIHYLSIAILSLLVLEAVLKVAAHGKHILSFKMEIIDALVNVASLVIDIMLTDANLVGAIGKVLVILTLIWRVFRILNAIIITSRARYKFRIRLLKKTKEMLEEKLQSTENSFTRAKREIGRLCQVATFYGAPPYEVKMFSDFVEEEKSAKFGLKASLMQLLRVNDAIAVRPFNRRQKVTEEMRTVGDLHPHPSLPNLSTLNHESHLTAEAVEDSSNFQRTATDQPTLRAQFATDCEGDGPSTPISSADGGSRQDGKLSGQNVRNGDAGGLCMQRRKSWPGGAFNRTRQRALSPQLTRGPTGRNGHYKWSIGRSGPDRYFNVNESGGGDGSAESPDERDAAKPEQRRQLQQETANASADVGAAAAESIATVLTLDERRHPVPGGKEGAGASAVAYEGELPAGNRANFEATSGSTGGRGVSSGTEAACRREEAIDEPAALRTPQCSTAADPGCALGGSQRRAREAPASPGRSPVQHIYAASADVDKSTLPIGANTTVSACQKSGLILCASALMANGQAHRSDIDPRFAPPTSRGSSSEQEAHRALVEGVVMTRL